jgi:hypothetical protein
MALSDSLVMQASHSLMYVQYSTERVLLVLVPWPERELELFVPVLCREHNGMVRPIECIISSLPPMLSVALQGEDIG